MNIKKTIGTLMMCAISATPMMAQQTSAESYQPCTYQEMEQLTVNEQVTTVITASEPIRFVDISTDKIAGDQPINNTVRLKPKEGLLTDCYNAESKFDSRYDYRAVMPQYRQESFAQNKYLFEMLDQLAEFHHATPGQVSLAWMLCKKPWIVPIPGTRRLCRMKENIGAADITLSEEEIAKIDKALDTMEMSEVFGGSKIVKE